MDLVDIRAKFQTHTPTLQDARAEYAVLVPLVETPDGLSLLYEVRASHLRQHASEVCFPGGRIESGETPQQCALRETQEELGISPDSVEILGRLDFLYLRSESLMHPILARVDSTAIGSIRLNREEVSAFFTVPLTWLRENPPQMYRYALKPMVDEDFPYELVAAPPAYQWRAGSMEVPVYRGLPYPLWGLTARITEHLVRKLYQD